MKASELRIGNFYNFSEIGDNDWDVITAKDILEFDADPIDDIYYPIPLTDEWLIKFGFEQIKAGTEKHYRLDFLNFYESVGSIDLEFDNGLDGYNYSTDIKYVHQLQNLYFALTGEELEIKD